MPLYPSNPPVTQALLKFGVGKEFVVAASVVEYTCGTGRVVFEGISKLADDIPRCREGSFAVNRSSYINISNSRRNIYFITHRVLTNSRVP